MKTIRTSILSALSLLLLLTGCEKQFLDIEPRNAMTFSVAITDLEGLEGAILGVYERGRFIYSDNNFSLYKTFHTDLVQPGTHIADQGIWNQLATFRGLTPANTAVRAIFEGYYAGIARANTIIENIDAVRYNRDNPLAVARRDRVLGEAYFFRAYFHLNLIQHWDNIVLADRVFSDPSQPITLAERSEVYQLIVSDLTTSIGLLPEATAVNSNGRVSKGVARHLLSLAYMDLEEYVLAAQQAELVIADPAYELVDVNGIFSFNADNQRSREIIFSWHFLPGNRNAMNRTVMQMVPLYDRVFGVARTHEQGGRPWSRMSVSPYYWTLFEPDDLRLEAWHKRYWTYDTDDPADALPEGVSIGDTVTAENISDAINMGIRLVEPTTKKYWEDGTFGRDIADAEGFSNVIQFRISEAYLIAAEAYYQSGTNTARGAELLNAVRARAGVSPIALTLDNILDEHARELGHEGRRYSMLKRLGILLERVRAHSPEIGANMEDHHVRWPLPRNFVELTGVPQNPGYDN